MNLGAKKLPHIKAWVYIVDLDPPLLPIHLHRPQHHQAAALSSIPFLCPASARSLPRERKWSGRSHQDPVAGAAQPGTSLDERQGLQEDLDAAGLPLLHLPRFRSPSPASADAGEAPQENPVARTQESHLLSSPGSGAPSPVLAGLSSRCAPAKPASCRQAPPLPDAPAASTCCQRRRILCFARLDAAARPVDCSSLVSASLPRWPRPSLLQLLNRPATFSTDRAKSPCCASPW